MYRVPWGNPTAGPQNEVLELAKAWVGTSFAFAILMRDLTGGLLSALPIALLTAGIGIVLHELAHRAVARHFGSWARFIANDGMILLAILMAFTGFLFAAPGAVWHSGRLSARQVGLIAAAGPITNVVLSVLFLLLTLVVQSESRLIEIFLFFGYQINAWLALFNMIPFGPLDGAKVFAWNQVAFGALAAIGLLLVFGIPRLLPLFF